MPTDLPPPIRHGMHAAGRTASRGIDRVSNAVEWLQSGRFVSEEKAPYELVHREPDFTLVRFHPTQSSRYQVPILLIPPLGVLPEIYDLRPEHSFVRHLVDAGFDLYMVDFGVPTLADRDKLLTDFALRFLPRAIEEVAADSQEDGISLVGYSMGGVMSIFLAGDSEMPITNLVTVGSPVDMRGLHPWDFLLRLSRRELDFIVATIGNIPPQLLKIGFRLSAPFKTFTVYRDLLLNLWNKDWIVAYESINSWIDAFIPFPGDTMRQFFHIIEGNRLVEGTMPSKSGRFSLANISSPILAIGGRGDSIVPEQAVERTVELVASEDATYVSVPGGHIGIIGGSSAAATTWPTITDWLSERSGTPPLRA